MSERTIARGFACDLQGLAVQVRNDIHDAIDDLAQMREEASVEGPIDSLLAALRVLHCIDLEIEHSVFGETQPITRSAAELLRRYDGEVTS